MSQPTKVKAKSLISVNQNCQGEQWGTISIKVCSGTTETQRNKTKRLCAQSIAVQETKRGQLMGFHSQMWHCENFVYFEIDLKLKLKLN